MNRKISMDREYEYRNGEPARVLCVDRNSISYPVVSINNLGNLIYHSQLGAANDACISSQWDLIEVKKKSKVWLNIYKDAYYEFNSKEEADRNAMYPRIACLEVEYYEGQGLEDE